MTLLHTMAFPGEKTQNTSTPLFELGTISIVGDRIWRYVKATSAVTAGQVVMATAPTQIANITGYSNTGDRNTGKYPYVEDTGISAMTVGYYDGCYMYIGGNTGVGQMKRIRTNTAYRIYFEAMYPELGEADVLSTSPDTTSDINIISPWHVAPVGASDKIQTPIGYAPFAFTAHYFGWVLVSGIGNPSMGGSGVIDTLVVPGDDTAGQGTIAGTGDDLGDGTPFGVALFAGADDTKWPVLFRGVAL